MNQNKNMLHAQVAFRRLCNVSCIFLAITLQVFSFWTRAIYAIWGSGSQISLLGFVRTRVLISESRLKCSYPWRLTFCHSSRFWHQRLLAWRLVVRRVRPMRSHDDPEMWWSVPFTCAWLHMRFLFFVWFLFIITIFIFIFNYVLIITFWISTHHKICILLNIYCVIWNYWIIHFVSCLEVVWSVMS